MNIEKIIFRKSLDNDVCPLDNYEIRSWKCDECKYAGQLWHTYLKGKLQKFTVECRYE